MRLISLGVFGTIALSLCALGADTSAVQQEYDRQKALVEAGAAPRASLQKLELALADAQDDQILRETLYGTLSVQDLTPEQAEKMVTAAQRQVDRQKVRVEEAQKLADLGVTPRTSVTPLVEELDQRNRALSLADSRAKLLAELAAMVRAEQNESEAEPIGPVRVAERFDGAGTFRDTDLRKVAKAFEERFDRPLPVSAKGETALHRSLGFDHRGRVDIALNPDTPEGVWLRKFMEAAKLPYFAFRAAVPGKATAPHIHLGPPSLRYRVAD